METFNSEFVFTYFKLFNKIKNDFLSISFNIE